MHNARKQLPALDLVVRFRALVKDNELPPFYFEAPSIVNATLKGANVNGVGTQERVFFTGQ